MNINQKSDDGERTCEAEILRLRTAREKSSSLREQAELSVEIEEVMGGRPPTKILGRRDDRTPDAHVQIISDETCATWEGGSEPDVTWGENGIDSLRWTEVECNLAPYATRECGGVRA
jgi:hypothetical protein